MIGARTAAGGRRHVGWVSQALLFIKLFLLGPAALPAVAPVTNQIVEEPALQVKTRANADRQVVQVHAVTLLVGEEQAQMAGDCEEQVVVEWRKLGESVAELLGCRLTHDIEVRVLFLKLRAQSVLQVLRENLRRELAQPSLEHAADGVRIVQLLLREQVDVKLCIDLLVLLLSKSGG